jgi:hypothetical protein
MSWRFVVSLAVALWGTSAVAGAKQEAAAAYRDGLRAQAHGQYREAAEAFIRSDAEVRRDATFEKALKAAARSNVSVLVMYLVSAAEGRRLKPKTAKLVRALRERHRERVGKLQVECSRGDPECSVHVREQVLRDGQSAFLETGPLTVQVHSRGEVESQDIDIVSSHATVVRPAPPAPARLAVAATETPPTAPEDAPAPSPEPASIASAPEPSRERAPLHEAGLDLTSRPEHGRGALSSPAFVWIGAGATALIATTAIVSGLDTRARYDQFVKTRAVSDREMGVRAQSRTNVLWISAGVVAVSTAVTALLVTDWSGGARVAIAPHTGGAMLAMEAPW